MTRKIMLDIYDPDASPLARYKALTVGAEGWLFLLRYELCMLLFRNVPGALGLVLRRVFFRGLFRRCGRDVLIGPGLTLRNPRRIELGDRVVLDEHCILDAKGAETEGIVVGDDVFLSHNTLVGCKDGGIRIGHHVSLGPNTIVQSVGASRVTIGHHVAIAPNCYLVGAADYRHDRTDVPMVEQGLGTGQGIAVGDDVWIASGVIVTDGSRIGPGCIIGGLALVRGEIPPYSIAFGVPATVRRSRKSGEH